VRYRAAVEAGMQTRLPFSLTLAGAACAYFVSLMASTGVAAQAPQTARFDLEVREDFFAGFSGNPERLARGMARAEAALAAAPEHAEAMVWHGGGLLFLAGQAFQSGDTATGMERFGRGLGEMNKAVELAPDRVGVRIPRGATLFEATRFMPAAQAEPLLRLAVTDFERALELQAPVFDSLGGHARGELLFGLADGYARLGDGERARQYFDRMTQEGGPSPRREYAAAWLSGKAPAAVPACGPCHSGR
jgi:pentatricopeptide repeat protein